MNRKSENFLALENSVGLIYKDFANQEITINALRRELKAAEAKIESLIAKNAKLEKVYEALPGTTDSKLKYVELTNKLLISPISFIYKTNQYKIVFSAIEKLLMMIDVEGSHAQEATDLFGISAEVDDREQFLAGVYLFFIGEYDNRIYNLGDFTEILINAKNALNIEEEDVYSDKFIKEMITKSQEKGELSSHKLDYYFKTIKSLITKKNEFEGSSTYLNSFKIMKMALEIYDCRVLPEKPQAVVATVTIEKASIQQV